MKNKLKFYKRFLKETANYVENGKPSHATTHYCEGQMLVLKWIIEDLEECLQNEQK